MKLKVFLANNLHTNWVNGGRKFSAKADVIQY